MEKGEKSETSFYPKMQFFTPFFYFLNMFLVLAPIFHNRVFYEKSVKITN